MPSTTILTARSVISMCLVRASFSAFMALAASAAAQFSTDLWPTTNVFRSAESNLTLVTNVTVLAFTETVHEPTSTGTAVYVTQFFHNIGEPVWWDAGTNEVWATNFYRLLDPGGQVDPPWGQEWTGRVWATTQFLHRAWHQTNLVLRLQARDRIAWEVWQAESERAAAAGLQTPCMPWFYRSLHTNLVAAKEWVLANAERFVIQQDLSAWVASNGVDGFPPKWTAAGLLASNGLPADYLTNTPWRALVGEGTNGYGYDGLRACLTNLVWTDADVTWSNGMSIAQQGYSYGWLGELIGAYDTWNDALMDTGHMVTNTDISVPHRATSGALADLLPYAYSSDRAHFRAWGTAPAGSACEGDLWARAAAWGRFGGEVSWDANGDQWSAGVGVTTGLLLAATIAKPAESNGVLSASVPAGASLAGGTAPLEPNAEVPTRSRGWVTDYARWVLRWDVTNGFRFR